MCAAGPPSHLERGPRFAVGTDTRTLRRRPPALRWSGDSTAFTLAIALSAEQRDYGVTSYDGGILGCGVTDGAEYQLQGVDAPMAPQCSGRTFTAQWPQLWLRQIAQFQPDVVMILAGRWEVVNRTYEGRWTNIDDPAYAAYVKRSSSTPCRWPGPSGAHVILMTAPCYDSGEQPNGDPWPEDSPTRLAIYNGLVREVAATSPDTSLLDFNAMACPGGQYEQYMDGVQVRLTDGVHFSTGGGVFASTIWPFVLRLGTSRWPERETASQPTRRRVLWSVWGNGSSNSFIFRTVTSS